MPMWALCEPRPRCFTTTRLRTGGRIHVCRALPLPSQVLVAGKSLWHPVRVKKKLHRCFVALGLMAMAMALLAIPAGITLSLSKSHAAVAMADDADGAMPCDHPCPGCAKPCPDMGSCLLKCFQQLSPTPVLASFDARVVRDPVPLGLSRRIAEAPIPPLLRPPSV
jgi:hypothetical protein